MPGMEERSMMEKTIKKDIWEMISSVSYSTHIAGNAGRADQKFFEHLQEGIADNDLDKIYEFIDAYERGKSIKPDELVSRLFQKAYSFFLHFGFSLFLKWNPKNHLLIFLFLAFFLIRVRKSAPLSSFLGRAYLASYLASYLAFFPKSRHFCPKTSNFAYFRTYIVFWFPGSISATSIVQNQRTNQPVSALVITTMPFQRLTRNAIGRL